VSFFICEKRYQKSNMWSCETYVLRGYWECMFEPPKQSSVLKKWKIPKLTAKAVHQLSAKQACQIL